MRLLFICLIFYLSFMFLSTVMALSDCNYVYDKNNMISRKISLSEKRFNDLKDLII